MSKITLGTSRPLVRRVGLGGRNAGEMVQPVYVVKGQLCAHKRGKLIPVQVLDANTVAMDITGAVAPIATLANGRRGLAADLQAVGAVAYKPAGQPAAQPKAAAATPAKGSQAAKDRMANVRAARTAQPSAAQPTGVDTILKAIMGMDDATKAALKAALAAGL